MLRDAELCCDEFRSAYAQSFANPVDRLPAWILYGTDHDSVVSGAPEIRYWPIRFCPFCGAALVAPSPAQRPGDQPAGLGQAEPAHG